MENKIKSAIATISNDRDKLEKWQLGTLKKRRLAKRIFALLIGFEVWMTLKIDIIYAAITSKIANSWLLNNWFSKKLFNTSAIQALNEMLSIFFTISGILTWLLFTVSSLLAIRFLYADYRITLLKEKKKQHFYKVAIVINIVSCIGLEILWQVWIKNKLPLQKQLLS